MPCAPPTLRGQTGTGVAIHKYAAILLASAFALAPCAARADTVADSVAEALSTHPDIVAGKAVASAAGKAVWEQKSGFFPMVGVHAGGGRENADNSTTRGIIGAGGASSWVSQYNVTVTQPLYSGFSVLNRMDAASDRQDVAGFDLQTASESLAARAARAHLNLMRTRELLDIAGSYSSEIQSRRDKIEIMLKEGAAEDLELLQAEDVLLAARNTRLGYEEAWRQAEADYIEVVGRKPEKQLDFGAPAWEPQIPKTVEDAVSAGLAASPAVLSSAKQLDAAGKDLSALEGDLMPRLDAELGYDRKNQLDALGGNSEDASALVRMSWNFSTGGAEIARMRRGEDQLSELSARRARVMRMTEHDIRQKFTSMQIVDEQFGVLVSRESAVENVLGSTLKQFEAGKQSNLQIISAHARLFDARAARADAYYRKLLSRFELLSVMGRLRAAFVPADAAMKEKGPADVRGG